MNEINAPESALRSEYRLFREGLTRLANAFLNRFFALSSRAASRRFWAFVFLFFFSGFSLSLFNYSLIEWWARLQDVLIYTLNSTYRATYIGNPFGNLLLFLIQVLIDPRNLRLIPLLLAPYFISIQIAAIYLADIFNLDVVSVARRHIREVALGGSDETIRFKGGAIADESIKSANFLIGGPGKVVVELDTVVVFELPDGTPRVIGPTGKEKKSQANIEGFERFREAFNLREHFVEFRDMGEKYKSVASRSKDGIPISATDVRIAFSVDRAEEDSRDKADLPYSYTDEAVNTLVYKATSKVTNDVDRPSVFEPDWVKNMTSLIHSELGKFMAQRNLTEYLANFGIPEVDLATKREEAISQLMRGLTPRGESPPEAGSLPEAPTFVPRPKITRLFTELENEFATLAKRRGVKLHWIGVGTWASQVEKVIREHIDAWKIFIESNGLDSTKSLEGLSRETSSDKVAGLIQEIPIASCEQAMGKTRASNPVMFIVLKDYRKFLIQASETWINKGETPPNSIVEAIQHLNRFIFRVRDDPPQPPDDGNQGDDPPPSPDDGNQGDDPLPLG